MKHQCAICKYAELDVPPPDDGTDDEGVHCHNRDHAVYLNAADEFDSYRYLNLWRSRGDG